MLDLDRPARGSCRWRAVGGRLLVVAWALAGMVVPAGLGAQPPRTLPEYEIKAALLLNFTRYVEWPEDAFSREDSPFVIGIFGIDPFGSDIDRVMEGRTSHGRPLEIRRLNRLGELEGCHVVFIGHGQEEQQSLVLGRLQGQPVLTVGESQYHLRDGGAINLVINRKNRIGFEVNLAVAEESGLQVSSRMLMLARRVIQAPVEGDEG